MGLNLTVPPWVNMWIHIPSGLLLSSNIHDEINFLEKQTFFSEEDL